LPRAIEMMKRREQEILKAILHLSDRTEGFANPQLIMIGGYALRAFTPLSRFTRDCDFALRKGDGWNIDELKMLLPAGYSIEIEEKRGAYGFLRCTKSVKHNRERIRVSMDVMEGEIRGRKPEEAISIDETMMKNRKSLSIPIAGQPTTITVPDYLDYFIIKVVSSRASDIRDIASLVHGKGIPSGLERRVQQILPHPEVFETKIRERIMPEIRRATFLDSWKGIFGTQRYMEEDRKKIIKQLRKLTQ